MAYYITLRDLKSQLQEIQEKQFKTINEYCDIIVSDQEFYILYITIFEKPTHNCKIGIQVVAY